MPGGSTSGPGERSGGTCEIADGEVCVEADAGVCDRVNQVGTRPDAPRDPGQAPWRPNREQLAAAWNRGVADVIAPGLDVLFVGINPGLWSGAVGHHFAHPSSRFWKALHASGFTPRLLSPFEEAELPAFRLGLTNLVDRATASATDLGREELRSGARLLERKVARHRPRWVSVLGVGAYRTAFDRPRSQVGRQRDRIAGADVWVLPGPSGLNAHYPIQAAIEAFRDFHQAVYCGRAQPAAGAGCLI